MRTIVLTAVLAGACGAADNDPLDRGMLGKADLFGSCEGTECMGAARDGNCYCDEDCRRYDDCCADHAALCGGGLTLATYNAGLAHGAVPFADVRIPAIVDELSRAGADVLCLQEVWLDADADAIARGLAASYPHSFRWITESDSTSWFACGITQWDDLYALNSCVSNTCAPQGISTFECVKDQCATQYAAIDDHCKLCLAANTTAPLKCAAWRAPMFGNDGRNGLLLLSREPIVDPSYSPFETYVIKRGVIEAEVGGLALQCTHMTADLESVPYPSQGRFASWVEEHRAQVALMTEHAGDRCTALMGDLNTGPAGPNIDAELGDNFRALGDAGWVDDWLDNQVCTYCGDNPLVCSNPATCGGFSSRIDHILFRGCDTVAGADYRRIADRAVTITDAGGAQHDGRASDHYGVAASVE